MQWCEMHGYVAVAQMSEREHLSAAGRASASEDVSSQQGGQLGGAVRMQCWEIEPAVAQMQSEIKVTEARAVRH